MNQEQKTGNNKQMQVGKIGKFVLCQPRASIQHISKAGKQVAYPLNKKLIFSEERLALFVMGLTFWKNKVKAKTIHKFSI
jgi:hypothetical protein